MDKHEKFYRSRATRTVAKLSSAKITPIADVLPPKAIVSYFLPMSAGQTGPNMDDLFIRYFDGQVRVQHITEFKKVPHPTFKPVPGMVAPTLAKKYHKDYRKLRPLHNLAKSAKNVDTLLSINGGLLGSLYGYPKSIMRDVYHHRNILSSVLTTMKSVMGQVDREHYIHVPVPARLLTPVKMDKFAAMDRYNEEQVASLATGEQLFLLELWRWMHGADSMFSTFTAAEIDRIHVFWAHEENMIMVPMQMLREAKEEELPNLGRRLILGLIHLVESSVTISSDTLPTKPANPGPSDVDEVPESDQEIEARIEHIESIERKESEPDVIVDRDTITLDKRLDSMLVSGEITEGQHRRLTAMAAKTSNIPNPFGGGGTLEEFAQIKDEDLVITDEEKKMYKPGGVIDDSMGEATLDVLQKKYRDVVMEKHIAQVALSVQKFGFVVNNLTRERITTISDDYYTYRLQVTAVDGSTSTIPFDVPVLDKEGNVLSAGVKYKHAMQRIDVPIRKTAPSEVALTSSTIKLFVRRSPLSKYNYEKWLSKQFNLAMLGSESKVIRAVTGKVFDRTLKLPRGYSTAGRLYREINFRTGLKISFEYASRGVLAGLEGKALGAVERKHLGFVVGVFKKQPVVLVDTVYSMVNKDHSLTELGTLEHLIGADITKRPLEQVDVSLYNKAIPMVFVIAMTYGLEELLVKLGAAYRLVDKGTRLDLTDREFAIRFEDQTLIVDAHTETVSLIVSGMLRYHKSLTNYPFATFNKTDVWINVLEENGFRIGLIRELSMTAEGFVDPIIELALKRMEEPTEFIPLLIRAVELLLTDDHPKETATEVMRFRGTERIPAIISKELSKSIREYRSRGIGEGSKLTMSPYAVAQALGEDSSLSLVEELNPIEHVKQREFVTFAGTDGRSETSMVESTREFQKGDVGVVSEAGVDSGKAGMNAYMSANARIADVYGMIDLNKDDLKPSEYFSTNGLLSPFTDIDDKFCPLY